MTIINMKDSANVKGWTPEDQMSVDELRAELSAMRDIVDDGEYSEMLKSMINTKPGQKPRPRNRASIYDGSFLSLIFTIVFCVIIIVSYYAFNNLYHAIRKRFPAVQHTEL